jgi:hypothetical protein
MSISISFRALFKNLCKPKMFFQQPQLKASTKETICLFAASVTPAVVP